MVACNVEADVSQRTIFGNTGRVDDARSGGRVAEICADAGDISHGSPTPASRCRSDSAAQCLNSSNRGSMAALPS